MSSIMGGELLAFDDIKSGMAKLRSRVETRDQMGGALYWNILNDEACAIATKLVHLGVPRAELADILGAGNYR